MHRKFTSMENSIFAKESISEYWSTKSDHKVNGMCICIEKKCISLKTNNLNSLIGMYIYARLISILMSYKIISPMFTACKLGLKW